MSVAGQEIASVFVGEFAERFAGARTPKELIVNERNTAMASCVLALEQGKSVRDGAPIFEQAIEGVAAEPTGLIVVERWMPSMRYIASQTYGPTCDPWDILDAASTGNSYEDVARASHPTSKTAKLLDNTKRPTPVKEKVL